MLTRQDDLVYSYSSQQLRVVIISTTLWLIFSLNYKENFIGIANLLIGQQKHVLYFQANTDSCVSVLLLLAFLLSHFFLHPSILCSFSYQFTLCLPVDVSHQDQLASKYQFKFHVIWKQHWGPGLQRTKSRPTVSTWIDERTVRKRSQLTGSWLSSLVLGVAHVLFLMFSFHQYWIFGLMQDW